VLRAGHGYITDSLKLAKMIGAWMALDVPGALVSPARTP
jgi:hypothetical protein